MSVLLDLWHSISAIFGSFDAITFAIMAIVAIGAGFMMPSMASIVTATFGALVVFALATFARTALASKDAETLARSDWHDLLMLQLHTLFVYALVFGIAITVAHTLRSVTQR